MIELGHKIDRIPTLESVKMEYAFLQAHLNILVVARFTYIGGYITASGLFMVIKPTFVGGIVFIFLSLFLWGLELRTRVLIRSCTARFIEIEETYFIDKNSYFGKTIPYQRKNPDPKFGFRTTPNIKEKLFLPSVSPGALKRHFISIRNKDFTIDNLLVPITIPEFVNSYSRLMDMFFMFMILITFISGIMDIL